MCCFYKVFISEQASSACLSEVKNWQVFARQERPLSNWIRALFFSSATGIRAKLAEGDVNRFLMQLAVKENVAAPTQNPARAAVLSSLLRVIVTTTDRSGDSELDCPA